LQNKAKKKGFFEILGVLTTKEPKGAQPLVKKSGKGKCMLPKKKKRNEDKKKKCLNLGNTKRQTKGPPTRTREGNVTPQRKWRKRPIILGGF